MPGQASGFIYRSLITMKSLWIAFCTSCLLASCASKPEPQTKAAGQSTLIGMIEMVNPEQDYVLIRCDQVLSLNAGTEVTALRSDGRKSKLVLTPERKGYYLTADIKEGQPAVSDLVLIQASDLPTNESSVPPSPASPVQPSDVRPSGSYTMPVLPQIPLTLPSETIPSVSPAVKAPEPKINLQELEPPVQ